MAGIRFKMMFGKTCVFKEVECFAGMFCKAVNRFFQAHVVAISHDVFSELLPGVFFAFRISVLHARAPSCEEAAAEVCSCMERRLTCVVNSDFTTGVMSLAGSHHTGTAAAENDYVNGVIPFGGKIADRSGSCHSGSGNSSGRSSSGCAEERTARKFSHFLFSFHFDVETVAIIAFKMRFAFNAVAVGAVLFTAVVAVRIGFHLSCLLSDGRIRLMAHQTVFCLSIVRKLSVHRAVFEHSC